MKKSFSRNFLISIVLLLLLVPHVKAQTVGTIAVSAFEFWTVEGPNGFSEDGFSNDMVSLTAGPGDYFIHGVMIDNWEVYTEAGYTADPPFGSGNGMFTISSDTPLPITLASFTAEVRNGIVELAWETATETNNARFIIYRNDETIGSVEGAGTTSEPHNYTYVDDAVVPGVIYTYILADVDYANNETRYDDNAVSVTVPNNLMEADFVINDAYPNPFNPSVAVSYQLPVASKVKANIYNTNGTLIENLLNKEMSAGNHTLIWNATDMPSGVYILKMLSGNVVNSQKLVLMK